MINLFVPGKPRPKGRPRFDRRSGRAYTPETTRRAEKELASVLVDQHGLPVRTISTGPIAVGLDFNFIATDRNHFGDYHVCRPDLDNLVKLVLDVMSNVHFWSDDSQVARIEATKQVVFDRSEVGTRLRTWGL